MNVVLSYGLGVDSTAMFLRWLNEPDSRDFDLDDLVVVTAMTGNEWPDTVELVERHILPRFREAGVTFAQVARAGASQKQGIVVLDESDEPPRLYAEGAYKLSDELTRAGTIPQAAGSRYCSQKFKGWPIDTYLAEAFPEARRHAFGYEAGELTRATRCAESMRLAFGFEAGETARARRATSYDTPMRVAEFPLIEWGWDREDCRRYIEQTTGVADWPKSACVYCPFALTNRAGRERTLRRYDQDRERLPVLGGVLLEELTGEFQLHPLDLESEHPRLPRAVDSVRLGSDHRSDEVRSRDQRGAGLEPVLFVARLAELLGQADDDALGAADEAEAVDVLVLGDLVY